MRCAAWLLFTSHGIAQPVSEGGIDPEVRERLAAATVFIRSELSLSARDWEALSEAVEPGTRRPVLNASGSGFLVTEEGHVVTNAHVVDGLTLALRAKGGRLESVPSRPGAAARPYDPKGPEEPFTLRFNPASLRVAVRPGEPGERVFSPRILKIDRAVDLALLKIAPEEGEPFDFLEVDAGRELVPGDPVLMMGFPGGALPDSAPFAPAGASPRRFPNPRPSLNAGTVTAIRERGEERRLQLDIRANHGNSGGPIVALDGTVAGILYAGIDSMQSINYAIPAAYLGRIATPELRELLGLPGTRTSAAPRRRQSYEEFLKSGTYKFGNRP